MTSVRLIAATAVVATSLLGLAGCSGDSDKEPKGSGSSGAAASPTGSVDPDKVSPTDLPTEPAVKDEAGAVQDATFGDCSTDAGKQTVTGSLTSSAKKSQDYVVTVSWVNDTSDVLARGVVVVKDLAPGASKKFTIDADVPKGAATCTFHVVRGTVS